MRIAPMSLDDLNTALDWAALEGWNPGLDDAGAFLAADPGGFLMGWIGEEPVASIAVVRHNDDFGFLGLYICRPDWRGKGHGWALWQAGLDLLGDRTVGLDGVAAQEANYARSGFVLDRRTVRHQGLVDPMAGPDIRPAMAAMMPDLIALDRAAHGIERAAYLTAWFTGTPARRTRVSLRDGKLTGLGTIRRCREGLKAGPLIAADAGEAEALLHALAAEFPGQPLALDVPDTNEAAMEMATRLGLQPVFGTARMYKGPAPACRIGAVFGETTLELG